MNSIRILAVLTIVVVAFSGSALAGTKAKRPLSTADNTSAVPIEEADEEKWSFSASAATYFIPDGPTYLQPTITADRGWLHLEARYNYEDLDTGSAWIGYNFSGGKKLQWEFTPMLGGVFGRTSGVAPGYEGSLSWRKLEFYSEGEFVFDGKNSADSFFYCWSELTLAPVEWFQFGLVGQRTRTYKSDRDIQRGPLVRVSYKKVTLTGYILNPDLGDPTFIFSVGLSF